jgi:catechol 2,3-dioxygenase-like lactoylglutathione lyase family enzyme
MNRAMRGIRLPLFTCCAFLIAASQAPGQVPVWVRQFGTTLPDRTTTAAPNGAGSVYFGGDTNGSLAGSFGSLDAWLALYDSAGNQLWIRQFGTSTSEELTAMASDGAGGVFVCGPTYGNLGGASAGGFDVWLARYDGVGNQLWILQFGSSADEQPSCSMPDGAGGVYLGGYTHGALGGPSAGADDAWLARYDGAGNRLWILQLGTSGADSAGAAATDGAGGVYVSGATTGNLGGTSTGDVDAWMARYDSAGNQLWIRQIGTSVADIASTAVSDGSGGLFVSGWTWGDLGAMSAGYIDAWTARYDSAGNQLWCRQLGTTGGDYLHAAAPDGSGGVIVCGRTDANLGGPHAGWWDIWLARYDRAGSMLWLGQFGSSDTDWPQAAVPDGSGGVYLGGWTLGSLGGPNAGMQDAWLARYAANPTFTCEPGLGGVIACPCANPPWGSGRGCNNSDHTGGARLFATGVAQLSADTLSFTASDERPSAPSVLLQGTSELSSGLVFGQGVNCVSGVLRRLYVRAASGGVVSMPNPGAGDPSISARSAALGDAILAGQSRWYAVYYRDPLVMGACSIASTFTTGPTMRADWQP